MLKTHYSDGSILRVGQVLFLLGYLQETFEINEKDEKGMRYEWLR